MEVDPNLPGILNKKRRGGGLSQENMYVDWNLQGCKLMQVTLIKLSGLNLNGRKITFENQNGLPVFLLNLAKWAYILKV